MADMMDIIQLIVHETIEKLRMKVVNQYDGGIEIQLYLGEEVIGESHCLDIPTEKVQKKIMERDYFCPYCGSINFVPGILYANHLICGDDPKTFNCLLCEDACKCRQHIGVFKNIKEQ